MRSTLFEDYHGLTTANQDAIRNLQIDFSSYRKIKGKSEDFVKAYISMFLTRNSSENIEKRVKITKEHSLDDSTFDKLSNITKFFIKNFLPGGGAQDDEPSNLVEDLIYLEVVSEEDKSDLILFLTCLKRLTLERIFTEYQKLNSTKRFVDSIKSLAGNISLRAIFEDEAAYGDEIKDYNPTCIGYVSVADFNLELTNKEEPIRFSCDKLEIKKLIDVLNYTLVELQNAEEFLNLE